MGRITIAGIGPGSREDITFAVENALRSADAVVGYKVYFEFIEEFLSPDCQRVATGMRHEIDRAKAAVELAQNGLDVVVISSGDAGIYGMAPLIHEMSIKSDTQFDIVTLPGVSAFQKAASLLGAPIGHDLCLISLSDLITPWSKIEQRIRAAGEGDFVIAVYNPKSHNRFWQLSRMIDILLQTRAPETPVGYMKNGGRTGQTINVTTLGELDTDDIDMFTTLIIGNSQTFCTSGKMITPRGYYREEETGAGKIGQNIMKRSFKTIEGLLKQKNYDTDFKWVLLHTIHTTADFDMENILYANPGALESIHDKIASGKLKTIVTDVTMVTSGIRKGALERLGIEAKCYLDLPEVKEMADRLGITRTQAGIRLAVEEHPDALFAFGNAPTALIELCKLIKADKARPSGVVAAPVGFVNVLESKNMIKSFKSIPKVIVEGRKGGSNIAATICNAIMTLDDANELKPGRDL